jgi:hypothetical protein
MLRDLILFFVFPVVALPAILLVLEATRKLWSR